MNDVSKHYPTIAVLLGGDSAERDVSIASGTMALNALKQMGCDAYPLDPAEDGLQVLLANPPSLSVIMLHGGTGENGQLQAWHEIHKINYTGSNSSSCTLAMHKHISKALWRDSGLITPASIRVSSTSSIEQIKNALAECALVYPCVIKPEDGGSSIYLFVVHSESELATAWQECQTTDLTFLLEEYIEGEEYTVSMLAGETLPSIRIDTASGLYDYHAKYQTDSTEFHFDTLSEPDERRLQILAQQAFYALGVSGWGRVDCIKRDDEFYFLEANLVPGMTDHSLLPAAAAHIGLNYQEVIKRIILDTTPIA